MKTPVRVKLAFLLCMILIAAAFAVFVGLRLRRPHPQACDFSALSETLSEAGTLSASLPGSDASLKRSFGLLPASAEEFLYFEPATFMDVDEVLVARVSSEAQEAEVTAAVTARIEAQKNNFERYGTDQYSLMNEALVYSNGAYVCYAAGHHAAEAMELIRKAVER